MYVEPPSPATDWPGLSVVLSLGAALDHCCLSPARLQQALGGVGAGELETIQVNMDGRDLPASVEFLACAHGRTRNPPPPPGDQNFLLASVAAGTWANIFPRRSRPDLFHAGRGIRRRAGRPSRRPRRTPATMSRAAFWIRGLPGGSPGHPGLPPASGLALFASGRGTDPAVPKSTGDDLHFPPGFPSPQRVRLCLPLGTPRPHRGVTSQPSVGPRLPPRSGQKRKKKEKPACGLSEPCGRRHQGSDPQAGPVPVLSVRRGRSAPSALVSPPMSCSGGLRSRPFCPFPVATAVRAAWTRARLQNVYESARPSPARAPAPPPSCPFS